MAALDEADPRWIVEKRADGRNVGNWHWTETDYTDWTKAAFEAGLKGLEILSDEHFEVKATTVRTEGEVSVSTRKGKVITFYELSVVVDWVGSHTDSGAEGEGSIKMPYISEENDYDDFEVQVTASKDTKDEKFRMAVRAAVIPQLRELVPTVLKSLVAKAAEKQLLQVESTPLTPQEALKRADAAAAGNSANTVERIKASVTEKQATVNQAFKAGSAAAKDSAVAKAEAAVKTTKFSLSDKFNCRPEDLWECLTDPNRVRAYAGGDSQMTTDVGGKFSLFGGAVTGEIVSVDKPKLMVQKWRAKEWPEGHFSTVRIELTVADGKTVMTINQSDVPESDAARTKGGWSSNFSVRIKGIFGFGGISF